METGLTGTPAMGQNPAAQDLIGTVSAISNSLMSEVGKVIIGKPCLLYTSPSPRD